MIFASVCPKLLDQIAVQFTYGNDPIVLPGTSLVLRCHCDVYRIDIA